MKKTAVVFCFAVLFVSVVVWAANNKADLSGTWQLDPALSDAAPKYNLSSSGGMGGGMGRGGGMGGGMGRGGGMGGGMGRGAAQMSKTLVIHQTAEEIRITGKAEANGQDSTETYKLDGKDIVEPMASYGKTQLKRVTKVRLSKDKLTINVETPSQYGSSSLRRREFLLSKDGNTLTLNISTVSTRSSKQKLVYHKE